MTRRNRSKRPVKIAPITKDKLPLTMDAMEDKVTFCVGIIAKHLSNMMVLEQGNTTRDKSDFPNGIIHVDATNKLGMVLMARCVVTEDILQRKTKPRITYKLGWGRVEGGIAPMQVESFVDL